jgi:hypothetical protein
MPARPTPAFLCHGPTPLHAVALVVGMLGFGIPLMLASMPFVPLSAAHQVVSSESVAFPLLWLNQVVAAMFTIMVAPMSCAAGLTALVIAAVHLMHASVTQERRAAELRMATWCVQWATIVIGLVWFPWIMNHAVRLTPELDALTHGLLTFVALVVGVNAMLLASLVCSPRQGDAPQEPS